VRRAFLLILSIFAASRSQANDPDFPVVRASFGAPVIGTRNMIGFEARLAFGSADSPWRFGGQYTWLIDDTYIMTPYKQVGAGHAWSGYEFSRTGPFSAMAYGGLGAAYWEKRWETYESNNWPTYKYPGSWTPSVLVGLDAGLSLWRHVGLSINAGTMIDDQFLLFATAQADIGNW
jgi:hypothetical protein